MAHNNTPNTLKHSLHDPHVGDGWMPSLRPQKHVDCLTKLPQTFEYPWKDKDLAQFSMTRT